MYSSVPLQDLLSLDSETGRTSEVGENEALVLLTGLFVGRAFVTSVSLKKHGFIFVLINGPPGLPMDYRIVYAKFVVSVDFEWIR